VVDPHSDVSRFAGVPVVKSLDDVADSVDAVLVTDIKDTRKTIERATARLGPERVLVPELLGMREKRGDAA
jgi:predicted CoA-binding protein